MITTNDKGEILKVEHHPVSREEIVRKQSELSHAQSGLKAKLDRVTSELATVNEDLAAFDRLVGSATTTGQTEVTQAPINEVEIK